MNSSQHPDAQVQKIRDALAQTGQAGDAARNRANVYKRAQFPAEAVAAR